MVLVSQNQLPELLSNSLACAEGRVLNRSLRMVIRNMGNTTLMVNEFVKLRMFGIIHNIDGILPFIDLVVSLGSMIRAGANILGFL